MPNSLNSLYHQEMLKLTQSPQFFCDHTQFTQSATKRNPLCGDWTRLGYIENHLYWHGDGCLICRASAEALCQEIAARNAQEKNIDIICQQIIDFYHDQKTQLPLKYQPLASVKEVKSRIKCVLLAVETLVELRATLAHH